MNVLIGASLLGDEMQEVAVGVPMWHMALFARAHAQPEALCHSPRIRRRLPRALWRRDREERRRRSAEGDSFNLYYGSALWRAAKAVYRGLLVRLLSLHGAVSSTIFYTILWTSGAEAPQTREGKTNTRFAANKQHIKNGKADLQSNTDKTTCVYSFIRKHTNKNIL